MSGRRLIQSALHKVNRPVNPTREFILRGFQRPATRQGLVQQFSKLGAVTAHQFQFGRSRRVIAVTGKTARGSGIKEIT